MDNLNNVKPSFGATPTEDNPQMQELINKRKNRPEIGAIWSRQSKTTDTKFLSIKLTFTKEKLEELLKAIPAEGEVVVAETSFVAFPNKFQEGNPKRPSYRIYEELNNT